MPDNIYIGFGTLLQIGDGGSPTEVFTTIAGVRDIAGYDAQRQYADGTNQTSPNALEEDIPTTLKASDLKYTINYDPKDTTHQLLQSLHLSAAKRNFKIVYTDTANSTETFLCTVSQFVPKAPIKNLLTADLTLKPHSLPTLT